MEKHFSEILGSSLDAWTIEYRVHATKRMFTRSIKYEPDPEKWSVDFQRRK